MIEATSCLLFSIRFSNFYIYCCRHLTSSEPSIGIRQMRSYAYWALGAASELTPVGVGTLVCSPEAISPLLLPSYPGSPG